MKIRVIIPFFLLISCLTFSQKGLTCQVSAGNFPDDTLSCYDSLKDLSSGFVRFSHSDGVNLFYWIRLSGLQDAYARSHFYHAAKSNGIFITDKGHLYLDSALFMSSNHDRTATLDDLSILFEDSRNAKRPGSVLNNTELTADGGGGNIGCETSQVACSNNIYTFPSGTTGEATPPVNGYPNYGCLSLRPCPAWYFMQVSSPGDIIILIEQSGNHDVDFICWGPVASLSGGCATGLTGTCSAPSYPTCCDNTSPACRNFYPRGNISDCSYSPNATETCHIYNAQVGEVYILLITNFDQQPATITFQQTGGTGLTNCNIVYQCAMIAVTANPSACDPVTSTFSVSGNIEFTNPPPTGTLTITDYTAIPPVSQTFSPPFVSPVIYNLAGIPCDGAIHSLTAAFSDSTSCSLNQFVTAPILPCPQALITGGGRICNTGSNTVAVNINLSGPGPYNFTYAINGVSQPPVNNYGGPLPYVLNTSIAGTYTMVSVSNAGCPGSGTISGSAVVIVDPLPVPGLNGPAVLCEGTTGNIYSTDSGKSNYQWVVSAGGTITSGGNGNNTVTVTWNTQGNQMVSVNYVDANGCTAAAPTVFPVLVNPLMPVNITISTPSDTICQGTMAVFTAVPVNPGFPPVYQWQVNGINAGGNSPTFSYIPVNGEQVKCSLTSSATCATNNPAGSNQILMTVHSLPFVSFTPCFDTIVPLNSKPITLSGGFPGGGTYSGTGVTSATSIFTPMAAGTGAKNITYTYRNYFSCISTKTRKIFVLPATVFTCGNTMTDIRDNKSYPTVQIGSQCWMAANLDHGTEINFSNFQFDNCVAEKYCFGDIPVQCASYGGLYQWDEIMRYGETPGSQGLCPSGWHIPSEDEWTVLFTFYLNNAFAGTALKNTGFSGFNAMLSGAGHHKITWNYQGFTTFFWTSTSHGSYKAMAHGLNFYNPSVSSYPSIRINSFPVRCLRD